ncbi:MAG: hypothetical protein AAFU64_07410, partial [Bacteroidota bacterium]
SWIVVDWVEIIESASPPALNEVTAIELYNASSNDIIDTLAEGNSYDIATIGSNLTLVARVGSNTRSVQMILSGSVTHSQIESQEPFALYGDGENNGAHNYEGGPTAFPSGNYTITVTPYDSTGGPNGSGTAGTPVTLNFSLSNSGTNTSNQWEGAINVTETIYREGKIGIGVSQSTDIPAGYDLAVAGKILTEEVRLSLRQNWPDYVFAEEYELMDLEALEAFIKKHQHLPQIPSAAEVSEEGIEVGSQQAALLEKVEELTLYIIAQNKQIKVQAQEKQSLEARLKALEEKMEKLLAAPTSEK